MSSNLTIRIPEATKELMKSTGINWSEDIRKYIDARVKSLELKKFLSENLPVKRQRASDTDSTSLIRKDRDGR